MPINPEHAEEFDPVDGVPTVSQLLKELDQSELNTGSADMQVSSMCMVIYPSIAEAKGIPDGVASSVCATLLTGL